MHSEKNRIIHCAVSGGLPSDSDEDEDANTALQAVKAALQRQMMATAKTHKAAAAAAQEVMAPDTDYVSVTSLLYKAPSAYISVPKGLDMLQSWHTCFQSANLWPPSTMTPPCMSLCCYEILVKPTDHNCKDQEEACTHSHRHEDISKTINITPPTAAATGPSSVSCQISTQNPNSSSSKWFAVCSTTYRCWV